MAEMAEVILDAAVRIGGYIDMQTVAQLFPVAKMRQRRATLARLIERGALAPVIAAGVSGVVYLTTNGQHSGVGQIPADCRAPATAGKRPHIQAAPIWKHNLLAATAACHLGTDGYTLPGELQLQKGNVSPDAIAYCEKGKYLIEVERMIGQGLHRWERRHGLLNKIWLHLYGRQTQDRTWVLAMTPRKVGSCNDAEAWLADSAQKRAADARNRIRFTQGIGDNRKVASKPGFYWLDIETPTAEPVWHPLTIDE